VIAHLLVQVTAHGCQAVVLREARIGVERLEQLEAARGPCTIATATARFKVSMGFCDMRCSKP